ncbi:hypothetical protein M378DRAFT_187911 [Amanita muscaria Koide BX008]|uniref:Uncharacterized protein n=1 Tax=Amanita muscaria (strain Koide BX008) TaxID=946122 RepID=A0A0C2WEC9_AMAMK|nr:hypothetical protein M378DRAFT_187911 [Amanita muscaria Koide BX008]
MQRLQAQVLHILGTEIASSADQEDTTRSILLSLSLTCHSLREACLPLIFAEVSWPHPNKNDEESGLYFFPRSLWQYFKHFHLIWPDEWPDANPPLWGCKYYVGGDYHPRHLEAVTAALPNMAHLNALHLSCPFYPPNNLLDALTKCVSLRRLHINDTPIYLSTMPKVPTNFRLESISLVPVAEAVRVGDGPYEPKFAETAYYNREYRRRYKNDILARTAVKDLLFSLGHPNSLRYVQVSCDHCNLDTLAEHEWPVLETLVLTGHAPRSLGNAELVDVIARMPILKELRLLFAKIRNDPFRLLPPGGGASTRKNHPQIFSQLKCLALSNACEVIGVLEYASNLECLAAYAVADLPQVPIALSRTDVDKMLASIAIGGCYRHLKRFRLIVEEKVHPELCQTIASLCSNLESLEIEICGYHDGKPVYPWCDYADAFSKLRSLAEVRVCIQFPEYDDTDRFEPWRSARKQCAEFLGLNVPSLQRVGFEYRKRTGTHRFEDRWLDFELVRTQERGLVVVEMPPSWYPFPEVWHHVPIPSA